MESSEERRERRENVFNLLSVVKQKEMTCKFREAFTPLNKKLRKTLRDSKLQ